MAEGDKRHAPTARRLQQAAEKGDVARSTDLPKAATAIAFTCFALGAAAGIGGALENDFAAWLAQAGTARLSAAAGWGETMMGAFGPLLALIAAIAVAASLASGGFVFSLQLLKFDFSKLLPSHGLGQLVSKHGLAETLKALLKFIIIGGIGADMIVTHVPEFAALAASQHPSAAPVIILCGQVLTAIAVGVALLAGADYGIQFWLHRQKLRMTDSEIRDEMKDIAGNPHVRNRQRMIARKLARARQMHRIVEASVIVTNPTHYAVAIRYRRGLDRAPLLLAKGVGLLAEEIISRGRAFGVPIVEAPPLARAVYRHVEPGEDMPVALYRACAEVLAYVWRMQRWRAQGGKRPMAPPVREGEIEV
jgi:flagellar biosynthetic protein FlhB